MAGRSGRQEWQTGVAIQEWQAGVTGRSGRRNDRKEWQTGVTGRIDRQEW